ncbi:MAG TPA: hypothetical protein VK427_12490, partial [Kofleriaceae bacterium]|nr:hypothetical protein [Kofleriaceae bacterium]
SEVYDLIWEHGFLRGASLKRGSYASRTKLAELTRQFLALPVARLVTELRFGLAGYENDNDWGPTLAVIAQSVQAPRIRVLRFDDYTGDEQEISWTAYGDFSPYWSELPALEDLRIQSGAGGILGRLELPNLRRFVRVSCSLGDDELRAIADARWPQLEHLEVWTGTRAQNDATAAHFAALLERRAPETLRHLGIVNSEIVGQLVEPLARSPLLRQLRTLDLSKGTLVDEDAPALIAHADAFRHLDRLDLSENMFDTAGAPIRRALANADVSEQRVAEGGYRYVALGE